MILGFVALIQNSIRDWGRQSMKLDWIDLLSLLLLVDG